MGKKISTTFRAYEGNEPYLFISYSHRDEKIVFDVMNRLDKEKYRMWYDDTMEVGEDFREELRVKIENCFAFIIFISESAMNSKYCGMEIITAFKNNKRIYPIYVDDDVQIPEVLKLILENLQHVRGLGVDDNQKYVDKLVESLPTETMRSLAIEDDVLVKCKDGSEEIDIPSGVKSVGTQAFKDCHKLKAFHFPDNPISIKDESFRGCINITEIHLPKNVQSVGESAFRDCTSVTKLVVENSDIEIGERAFENCRHLESITLPHDMMEIYGGTFNSCKKLETITLPEELVIIGENSFASCSALKEIRIPEKVRKIDDLAFAGCTQLKTIEINDGLGKIGKNTFKDCKCLERIFIPKTVYDIGTSPLRGCEKLEAITVDKKNRHFKSVDDILFNKNKSVLVCYPAKKDQKEYEIPDSITEICDWAFCECENLEKIVIPDSVTKIGEGAFYKCKGLKELEIPDSVESIDDTALRGCVNLETIVIPSSVKEFGWGLLNGCENVTVICEEGSEAARYCEKKKIPYKPS